MRDGWHCAKRAAQRSASRKRLASTDCKVWHRPRRDVNKRQHGVNKCKDLSAGKSLNGEDLMILKGLL